MFYAQKSRQGTRTDNNVPQMSSWSETDLNHPRTFVSTELEYSSFQSSSTHKNVRKVSFETDMGKNTEETESVTKVSRSNRSYRLGFTLDGEEHGSSESSSDSPDYRSENDDPAGTSSVPKPSSCDGKSGGATFKSGKKGGTEDNNYDSYHDSATESSEEFPSHKGSVSPLTLEALKQLLNRHWFGKNPGARSSCSSEASRYFLRKFAAEEEMKSGRPRKTAGTTPEHESFCRKSARVRPGVGDAVESEKCVPSAELPPSFKISPKNRKRRCLSEDDVPDLSKACITRIPPSATKRARKKRRVNGATNLLGDPSKPSEVPGSEGKKPASSCKKTVTRRRSDSGYSSGRRLRARRGGGDSEDKQVLVEKNAKKISSPGERCSSLDISHPQESSPSTLPADAAPEDGNTAEMEASASGAQPDGPELGMEEASKDQVPGPQWSAVLSATVKEVDEEQSTTDDTSQYYSAESSLKSTSSVGFSSSTASSASDDNDEGHQDKRVPSEGFPGPTGHNSMAPLCPPACLPQPSEAWEEKHLRKEHVNDEESTLPRTRSAVSGVERDNIGNCEERRARHESSKPAEEDASASRARKHRARMEDHFMKKPFDEEITGSPQHVLFSTGAAPGFSDSEKMPETVDPALMLMSQAISDSSTGVLKTLQENEGRTADAVRSKDLGEDFAEDFTTKATICPPEDPCVALSARTKRPREITPAGQEALFLDVGSGSSPEIVTPAAYDSPTHPKEFTYSYSAKVETLGNEETGDRLLRLLPYEDHSFPNPHPSPEKWQYIPPFHATSAAGEGHMMKTPSGHVHDEPAQFYVGAMAKREPWDSPEIAMGQPILYSTGKSSSTVPVSFPPGPRAEVEPLVNWPEKILRKRYLPVNLLSDSVDDSQKSETESSAVQDNDVPCSAGLGEALEEPCKSLSSNTRLPHCSWKSSHERLHVVESTLEERECLNTLWQSNELDEPPHSGTGSALTGRPEEGWISEPGADITLSYSNSCDSQQCIGRPKAEQSSRASLEYCTPSTDSSELESSTNETGCSSPHSNDCHPRESRFLAWIKVASEEPPREERSSRSTTWPQMTSWEFARSETESCLPTREDYDERTSTDAGEEDTSGPNDAAPTDALVKRALQSLTFLDAPDHRQRAVSPPCAAVQTSSKATGSSPHDAVSDKSPFDARTVFQRVLRDVPEALRPPTLKIFDNCTVLETWRAVCCSEPSSAYYGRRLLERQGSRAGVAGAVDECTSIILTQIARVKDWFGSETVDGVVCPLERRRLGRHLERVLMVFRMPLHACLKAVPAASAANLKPHLHLTLQDSWTEVCGIQPSVDIYRYFSLLLSCLLSNGAEEGEALIEVIRVVISRLHLFAELSESRPQSVFHVVPRACHSQTA